MPSAVMTFSTLMEDLESYLERTDSSTLDMRPTFIMLCEQQLALDIKFLGNLIPLNSTMSNGNGVIEKPALWRKTVSMNLTSAGERFPLFLRTYEYVRNYAPDPTATGRPQYYCDYDYGHWLVAPTPDASYSFESLSYCRVPPLSDENQQNWFTQNAPQAMLYGSLLQAMPFLKNDPRIPVWQSMYNATITALKGEDLTRVGDRQSTVLDK